MRRLELSDRVRNPKIALDHQALEEEGGAFQNFLRKHSHAHTWSLASRSCILLFTLLVCTCVLVSRGR